MGKFRGLRLIPPKFLYFARENTRSRFRLLDVGCGNHSVRQAKRWFPNCEYFGIDRGVYNNDDEDFLLMERFFELDLAQDDLAVIPDSWFDLIVVNHVIEHLYNGEDVIGNLTKKLRKGGRMYIEFPGEHSLALPSMSGTLNFCDDPTHVRVYSVREVANVLLANGLRIKRGGVRRDWRRILLFPVLLVRGLWQGNRAGAFWDLLGFAEFVYAYAPDEDRKS